MAAQDSRPSAGELLPRILAWLAPIALLMAVSAGLLYRQAVAGDRRVFAQTSRRAVDICAEVVERDLQTGRPHALAQPQVVGHEDELEPPPPWQGRGSVSRIPASIVTAASAKKSGYDQSDRLYAAAISAEWVREFLP